MEKFEQIQPNAVNDEKSKGATRLIPLSDWPKYHPWPPIGGLRHLAFFRTTNGFDKVIKKVGKRLLIDERSFFDYVQEINGK
jgi:hypothetical protein